LLTCVASAAATLLAERRAFADDVPVPIALQVELLSRIVAYDRNFSARVRGRAQVLILTQPGEPLSERVARHLEESFARVEYMGKFPHDLAVFPFADALTLTKQCRARSIDIVYVTPGLEHQLPEIVSALTGLDLLSVAASPAQVPERLVLGFDLVSGRPKVLVHLAQARLQNVAFRSDFLKLARVYQ
jgi:hypothetical protein